MLLWGLLRPNGSGSVVRGRGPDFARSTVLGWAPLEMLVAHGLEIAAVLIH